MSYIVRRGLSTLIPPKIASPQTHRKILSDIRKLLLRDIQGIGAAQDAARMTRVVSFYEKLPRGPAETPKPRGLLERYQARYFGDNPSAAPIWHAILGLGLLGYSFEYYFHLRHHKNHAH